MPDHPHLDEPITPRLFHAGLAALREDIRREFALQIDDCIRRCKRHEWALRGLSYIGGLLTAGAVAWMFGWLPTAKAAEVPAGFCADCYQSAHQSHLQEK